MANLMADDIPTVAKALTACLRSKGGIGLLYANGIPLVRLSGVGFNLYIRSEDWLLIAPYLVDGTFNPQVVTYPLIYGDPPLDVSTIDLQDQTLYQRIVGVLSGLFTTRYPRSSL